MSLDLQIGLFLEGLVKSYIPGLNDVEIFLLCQFAKSFATGVQLQTIDQDRRLRRVVNSTFNPGLVFLVIDLKLNFVALVKS